MIANLLHTELMRNKGEMWYFYHTHWIPLGPADMYGQDQEGSWWFFHLTICSEPLPMLQVLSMSLLWHQLPLLHTSDFPLIICTANWVYRFFSYCLPGTLSLLMCLLSTSWFASSGPPISDATLFPSCQPKLWISTFNLFHLDSIYILLWNLHGLQLIPQSAPLSPYPSTRNKTAPLYMPKRSVAIHQPFLHKRDQIYAKILLLQITFVCMSVYMCVFMCVVAHVFSHVERWKL